MLKEDVYVFFLDILENFIIWVCDEGIGVINGFLVNFFFY